MKYTIGTVGSHSCLQILKGAKDEGFCTLAIVKPHAVEFYQQFPFIDTIVTQETFVQTEQAHVILIPHGSFVAYGMIGEESPRLFGNREILEIEADRQVQHKWMTLARVLVPKIFAHPHEVDRPVIIKYFGAKGGQGYQIAANREETQCFASLHKKEQFIIQEYIVGTPVYCQYFYSVVHDRLEILGFDRRYETDVDGIGRVPASLQQKIEVNPTFTVIGNLPLVVRESLLPAFYDMGKKVITAAKKLTPAGLWGPFCLETIITPDQKIIVIEISARIVAGTNLYINGSPYTDLLYNEPMSMGRRIAREIKEAEKNTILKYILT